MLQKGWEDNDGALLPNLASRQFKLLVLCVFHLEVSPHIFCGVRQIHCDR